MMEIREGVCCAQLEHTRMRRDRCLVRSVQDLKEEKSPRWSELETFQSAEVRRLGFGQFDSSYSKSLCSAKLTD